MVAADPTGASALTVTPALDALVSTDNSTEPVEKNDGFDEIKNKFLNEIDKIPRECCTKHQSCSDQPTCINVTPSNDFGMRFTL